MDELRNCTLVHSQRQQLADLFEKYFFEMLNSWSEKLENSNVLDLDDHMNSLGAHLLNEFIVLLREPKVGECHIDAAKLSDMLLDKAEMEMFFESLRCILHEPLLSSGVDRGDYRHAGLLECFDNYMMLIGNNSV